VVAYIYSIFILYKILQLKGSATSGERIPNELILTCIDNICQSFLSTIETLSPVLDASEDMLNILACQVELLLLLTRTVCKGLSVDVSLLVMKCASSGLKLLSELKLLPSKANLIMKLLLTLLLLVLQSNSLNLHFNVAADEGSGKDFSKVSNATLGILPILCNCIATSEHCMLSLSVIDLILGSFLMPRTWLPVLQNHLQMQFVMLKLQDKNSSSIPIIMKFFLTIAQTRGGAEMLYSSGFLSSLRVLFAQSGEAFSIIGSPNLSSACEKVEIPQDIWGLGLAVVTAMVQSLGDSSSGTAIVESMMPYFFSEKAHLIFNSLDAPDFPSEDHDKKRARAQRPSISFANLKETEHTLMLMCELAKHWNSWIKAINNVDKPLREKCIHFLAFVSRGTQRLGESSIRSPPLLCPPTLKEDFEICSKPSYINSKNGWFALSPPGCVPKPKMSSVSNALSIYGQATETTDVVPKTCFSDTVAVQVYKITFLLLKFLCLQAEGAAKRAEEVGFVDLANFPELPMPEILHGLQVTRASQITCCFNFCSVF
jgi:nuclear pore complex protein Nup188